MLAKNVPALAHLVGPHIGIAIPLRGDFRLRNFRRHALPPARAGDARLKKIRTRKSRPLKDRALADAVRMAIHILRVWPAYARSSTLTRVRRALIVNA